MTLTRRTMLRLLGATSLAGAAASGWAGPARSEDLTKIKIVGAAAVNRPDLAFMYAGIPLGFYKQLGIDADFFTVGGSAQSIQLVATDQAQLGHAGMQELMAAKQKQPSLPVRAVYLQDIGAGYEIVVPQNGSIKTLGDLKDKRIGVMTLASGAVPFVKAMLSQAGIKDGQYELLPVGTGAQALAALQANRVDALSLFRGQHAAIENLGITFHYFTVPYPSSVLVANETFLKSHREALVHALQGIVLNSIYTETDPEGAVRTFWQVSGPPKGDEKKEMHDGVHLIERATELWKQKNDNRKWGEMSDADWTKLAQFSGIQITPEEVHALYTDDLIAEVNKVDSQIALRAAQKT
jgi:NitT/TauT family transport system substrate-binding protein